MITCYRAAPTIIFAVVILISCTNNDLPDPVDCTTSDLAVKVDAKVDPTLCNSTDGSIAIAASGGKEPYTFRINNGDYQSSNSFQQLGAGTYSLFVKDANGCESSVQQDIASPASTLTASSTTATDTECFSDNGSITVLATEGKPPYTFKLENGPFGDASTFSNLKFGDYTVTVLDAEGCSKLLSVTVPRGLSGLSYSNDIVPIISTKCAVSGCHNGDLGDSRNWTKYGNVKNNASNIKTRTANRTMPAGGLTLTQEQIDKIGCWVDDGAPEN